MTLVYADFNINLGICGSTPYQYRAENHIKIQIYRFSFHCYNKLSDTTTQFHQPGISLPSRDKRYYIPTALCIPSFAALPKYQVTALY